MIVASGYANDPVMANYKNYGFKGVVVKPCEFEDLRQVLTRVLITDRGRICVKTVQLFIPKVFIPNLFKK